MNMPGFIAEVALVEAPKGYRMSENADARADASKIVPQIHCFRRGRLFCCCYDFGGLCECHPIYE